MSTPATDLTASYHRFDTTRATQSIGKINLLIETLALWLMPIADLLARWWVAAAFFSSGLTKTLTGSATWFGYTFSYPLSLFPTDSTFTLFRYEYHVPLLSPTLAAYMGTAAELILPVFLLLGLAGRYAALALFIFNIIAALSYPDLQPAGLNDHKVWGILLLITFCHGPGKLSLDYLLSRRAR